MKRLTLNNIPSKLIAKVREKINCFRTFGCTHVAEKYRGKENNFSVAKTLIKLAMAVDRNC